MKTNSIHWPAFMKWLQQRLQQNLPGYEAQSKMMSVYRPDGGAAPVHARHSGVLLLLYPDGEDIYLVLIERSADGGVHSGQVALPGGRKEETDKHIYNTALRESNEEIALDPNLVTIIGQLSSLYIPASNFVVYPVVGFSDEVPMLSRSDAEVAQILQYPLDQIFSNVQKLKVPITGSPQISINALAYLLPGGRYVWGATAMILSELESLIQEWQQLPDLITESK